MYMRGFTLIETLVVLAISSVVLVSVFAGFFGFTTSFTLSSINEDAISLVRKAREQTLSSEGGVSYGIHFDPDSITLFTAPTFDENDSDNERYDLPDGFTIIQINLVGGTSDAIFTKLTGATDQFGTVVIQKKNNPAVQSVIHIYESGVVQIE